MQKNNNNKVKTIKTQSIPNPEILKIMKFSRYENTAGST